tara:strand:- start:4175 stop:5422 length:1248 start_codon:yes stop_codon:yes gene_type:complete
LFALIPIFSDPFLHPYHHDNDLSLLYVRHYGDREGRMICINHPDCGDKESIDDIKNNNVNFYLTPDKKKLMNIFPDTRLIDVNMMTWLKTNKPLNFEDIRINAYDFFHSKYYNVKNLNLIIPLVKHKEYCDRVFDRITENIHQVYEVMYTEAIEAFSSIEKNGIRVTNDVCDIFDERVRKHISNGKLYSQYNLWTSTGRPSNSFGSVNFAALNKEQRKAFIPENDMLVEYDYDAYHLRLIGELIDYKFGDESVHKHLAEFYGCSYEESKAKTFKLLYGGISSEIRKSIPFFDKTQNFMDNLWEKFNGANYIKTYIYNRRIKFSTDLTKNKLFNYYIQSFETEHNIKRIVEIQKILKDYKSKMVLYGYDSFLIDFDIYDGIDLLKLIKSELQGDNYMVKIKSGKQYNKLKDITHKL